MRSSRLKHKITIQHPIENRDLDTGAFSITWQDLYKNISAEVLTGAGKEPHIGGSDQPETTARITTRYFPHDTKKLKAMRILWLDREFDIKGVMTDATARRWIRFECVDGLGGGE